MDTVSIQKYILTKTNLAIVDAVLVFYDASKNAKFTNLSLVMSQCKVPLLA
jgi:hypothetical protein